TRNRAITHARLVRTSERRTSASGSRTLAGHDRAKRDPDLAEPAQLAVDRWLAIADVGDEQHAARCQGRERRALELRAVAGLGERRADDRDDVEPGEAEVTKIAAHDARRKRVTFAALPHREGPADLGVPIDARDRHAQLVSEPVVPQSDADADVA